MGGTTQGCWNPAATLGSSRCGVPPWLSPNVRVGCQLGPGITFGTVFWRIFVSTSPSLLKVLLGLLLLLSPVAV